MGFDDKRKWDFNTDGTIIIGKITEISDVRHNEKYNSDYRFFNFDIKGEKVFFISGSKRLVYELKSKKADVGSLVKIERVGTGTDIQWKVDVKGAESVATPPPPKEEEVDDVPF